MDFHSLFSDFSAQNAATTIEQMKEFIYWMYYNNFLIMYVIIYDTTYGCSKQHIFENKMRILYVLKFTYRVIIDIWTNDIGHGRIKIDDINWYEKSYLK